MVNGKMYTCGKGFDGKGNEVLSNYSATNNSRKGSLFQVFENSNIEDVVNSLIENYPISFLWGDTNTDETKKREYALNVKLSRCSREELKILNDEFEDVLKNKVYKMLFGQNNIQNEDFDINDFDRYIRYYFRETDFAKWANQNCIYLECKKKHNQVILSLQRRIDRSSNDLESINIPFKCKSYDIYRYKADFNDVKFINNQPFDFKRLIGKQKYINLIIRKIEFIQRVDSVLKQLSSDRVGSKHLGMFGKKQIKI